MGDDDEGVRFYTPILQRIFVLMALIAVVPAALWGITTFVRSYVEQPKTPMFRRVAATAETPAPKAAGQDDGVTQAVPPETKGLASPAIDVGALPDEAQGASPTTQRPQPARLPDAGGNPALATLPQPVAAPATVAVSAASAAPAASLAVAETAGSGVHPSLPGPPQPGMTASSELTTGSTAVADEPALVPDPISGPVPLPRQRPRSFVMAELGVPLPRPRPELATPAPASAPENPFGWMRNIFQPQNPPPNPAPNAAPSSE